MVDIVSELSSNQTLLLIMNTTQYNDSMVDILKKISGGSVCYMTANKTYDSLKEVFEKNKVDLKNVVFIDAISKTFKKSPDQAENVYYISSPGALTEMSLVISKFLRHNFEYFVFDSLTNLGIYNKPEVCAKFLSSLVNNIKKGKTKAVFYGIGSKTDKLLKHASLTVEKVVELGEDVKAEAPVKKVIKAKV
jgi:hypothetical protein